MQKNLLDATAEQAHSVAESYREDGKLQAAARVTELTRRGIQEFVDSEKKFLDLAMQEVTAATKNDKRCAQAAPGPRGSVDKSRSRGRGEVFRNPEKAHGLCHRTVRGAPRKRVAKDSSKSLAKKARPSLGELTEKSMKNFVNAEKSLLDLAMNPAGGPGEKKDRKPYHGAGTEMHHAGKEAAGEGKHGCRLA